ELCDCLPSVKARAISAANQDRCTSSRERPAARRRTKILCRLSRTAKAGAVGAYRRMLMNRLIAGALLAAGSMLAGEASAQDIKIALIYSKTGPLEAYAKQTENGLTLGLEYLTQGSLSLNGRKITVLPKDDQGKPDVAKSLLEQAYADDKVDLAIGTTASGS